MCSSTWAQASQGSFEEYVKNGNVDTALKMVKADPSIKYPLHIASNIGNVQVIGALLDAGHDINSANNRSETPLHLAAQRGRLAAVQLLLKRRANVNAKTKNGQTPLLQSAERGHANICETLLEHGADINAAGNIGNTAVHLALIAGRDELASIFLKTGKFELFAKNREGLDCFDLAVDNESVQTLPVIIFLVSTPRNQALLGGNKYLRDGVFRAVMAEKVRSIETILKFSKIQDDEYDLYPPYLTAAEYGKIGVVKHFLGKGLDVNTQFGDAEISLLHMAAGGNHTALVNVLLDRGANINIQDSMGWTPLFHAIFHQRTQIIPLLLEKGADTDVKDYRGFTPTHMAMRTESLAVVNLLLAHGVDLDAPNNVGVIPLAMVPDSLKAPLQVRINQRKPKPDNYDIAGLYVLGGFITQLDKFLSENELDVNLCRNDFSLFHTAIQTENVEMVKFLMKKGANIQTKTTVSNWSPLHLSVTSLNADLINLLVMNGASMNEADVRGMTPLHVAAFQSKASILRGQSNSVWDLLIKAGADPTIKNNRGELAEDLLVKNPDNTQKKK
jgi:ankyrin repeat protein